MTGYLWRRLLTAFRRWRMSRHIPTPAQFEMMSRNEFETYVRDIGFGAQIEAALAVSDNHATEGEPQ